MTMNRYIRTLFGSLIGLSLNPTVPVSFWNSGTKKNFRFSFGILKLRKTKFQCGIIKLRQISVSVLEFWNKEKLQFQFWNSGIKKKLQFQIWNSGIKKNFSLNANIFISALIRSCVEP